MMEYCEHCGEEVEVILDEDNDVGRCSICDYPIVDDPTGLTILWNEIM